MFKTKKTIVSILTGIIINVSFSITAQENGVSGSVTEPEDVVLLNSFKKNLMVIIIICN